MKSGESTIEDNSRITPSFKHAGVHPGYGTTELAQLLQDQRGTGFRICCDGKKVDFGRFRRLVFAVDSSEIFQFAAAGFCVKSF